MKVWVVVVSIAAAGSAWANNPTDQNKLLNDLFANITPNDLPLKDSYFTIREDSAPTLYRFNMTNGFFRNLHKRLTPKFHEEFCNVRVDRYLNNLRVKCDFDLEGMMATYDGALSYGASVVQNFTIKTFIIKHSGVNPPLLSVYTGDRMCKSDRCPLSYYEVYITAFELNTTASPKFSDFKSNPKFQNFVKNPTLAEKVWTDFNVKMYTDILPIIVNTLKATYRSEIPKRMTKVGALKKNIFRG
ncbi:hypothetical protein MRX96_017046 [Rhipicephalus microplus]|nr:uncharacterized protein LOC119160968 [Rhipicephalus microplus]XP_037269156.1 uncharacterized protein LOC119160968 [Rhipicephalus microplus]XP_037269157.1 uncharacterized protein LOC119160968 [Rhipicephalus microplus]XP_037269158.1 uncharacterized protein LOC119160968 [Rhipicephalus microplus]